MRRPGTCARTGPSAARTCRGRCSRSTTTPATWPRCWPWPAPMARTAPGRAGAVAVAWALAQDGTPYLWGGETPGVGFDCSGLAQAAYQAAGGAFARVAQDQFRAGPHMPPGAALEPGD